MGILCPCHVETPDLGVSGAMARGPKHGFLHSKGCFQHCSWLPYLCLECFTMKMSLIFLILCTGIFTSCSELITWDKGTVCEPACAQGMTCDVGVCVSDGTCGNLIVDMGEECDEQSTLCVNCRRACAADSSDCPANQICDPVMRACTDYVPQAGSCSIPISFDLIKPVLKWRWPLLDPAQVDDQGEPQYDNNGRQILLKPEQGPEYTQIMMMPVVINLTDDNADGVVDETDTPDIVVTTFKEGKVSYEREGGIIRVLSGDSGQLIASTLPLYHASDDLAVSDLDGDGYMELVASTGHEIHLLRFNKDKTFELMARLPFDGLDELGIFHRLNASHAHLDDGNIAKVITSFGVLEWDGASVLEWRQNCQRALGPFPVALDLDADGQIEIVGAEHVYDANCNELTPIACQGVPSVADLLKDTATTGELKPEIVCTVSQGQAEAMQSYVHIIKLFKDGGAWHSTKAAAYQIPSSLHASSSTTPRLSMGGRIISLADFNADNKTDIAFAAHLFFMVLTINEQEQIQALWLDTDTEDRSSGHAGSSVFDFNGDNRAEVLYADEHSLRIYDSLGSETAHPSYPEFKKHKLLFSFPNSSSTKYEYPVVADIDNNESSEIVLVANDFAITGPGTTRGLRVLHDPKERWMSTRRIWNQHAYYVTNVEESGQIPVPARLNWLQEALNNFRQSLPSTPLHNSANLTAGAVRAHCENGALILSGALYNTGATVFPAGRVVEFYRIGDTADVKIGELQSIFALDVGQNEVFSINWTAPADTVWPVQIYFSVPLKCVDKKCSECTDKDNTSAPISVPACPNP